MKGQGFEARLRLRLERARWFLLQHHAFYGTLAMNLRDVLDDSAVNVDPVTGEKFPTCMTNGEVIKWHPDYLGAADYTDEELRYDIVHETGHPAHGHLWRLPADEIGNIAADMGLERIMRGMVGLSQRAGGIVCPPEFEGLAEEEIDRRLRRDPAKGRASHKPGGKPEGCGGRFEAPAGAAPPESLAGSKAGGNQPAAGAAGAAPAGGTEGKGGTVPGAAAGSNAQAPAPAGAPGASGGDLRDQWTVAVSNAITGCKGAGAGRAPAALEAILERVTHQAIDWRSELFDFARSSISERSDWSRPARRVAWMEGIRAPRRRRDDFELLVFPRDTSGSISYAARSTGAEFTALIQAAVDQLGCRGLVLDWGSGVVAEHWIEPGGEVPLKVKHGGGTEAAPVFERIAELVEQGERVAGACFLSDCDLADADECLGLDVAFPVLWLSTTKLEGPHGRTVRIEARSPGD